MSNLEGRNLLQEIIGKRWVYERKLNWTMDGADKWYKCNKPDAPSSVKFIESLFDECSDQYWSWSNIAIFQWFF